MAERLLLDTHIALWWLTGDKRLRAPLRNKIGKLPCLFSVVSAWEVGIKHRLGKLNISTEVFVQTLVKEGAEMIHLQPSHIQRMSELPEGHRDPFDLMLVATSQLERLELITADEDLMAYLKILP